MCLLRHRKSLLVEASIETVWVSPENKFQHPFCCRRIDAERGRRRRVSACAQNDRLFNNSQFAAFDVLIRSSNHSRTHSSDGREVMRRLRFQRILDNFLKISR